MALIAYAKVKIDKELFHTWQYDPGEQYLFRYAILRNPSEIHFTSFSNLAVLSDFPEGRIWGETLDLQWKTKNGIWHFVLIAENESDIPDFFQQENRKKLTGPLGFEEKAFLWGEYDDSINKWLEVKVPKQIDYASLLEPTKQKSPRVRLEIIKYTTYETRDLWCFGEKINLAVDSSIYRYGKVIEYGGGHE